MTFCKIFNRKAFAYISGAMSFGQKKTPELSLLSTNFGFGFFARVKLEKNP
jgi:hypothetical protein